EITRQIAEVASEGASAFMLGSVLDRYFARHVSINSFTETVLRSENRGEINRWEQQWGERPTRSRCSRRGQTLRIATISTILCAGWNVFTTGSRVGETHCALSTSRCGWGR